MVCRRRVRLPAAGGGGRGGLWARNFRKERKLIDVLSSVRVGYEKYPTPEQKRGLTKEVGGAIMPTSL